jgi:amidase
MNNIVFSTASELAAAIRTRQISASDVVAAFEAQIAQHNPQLNAIVTLDIEGARQRAREADRALESGDAWGPLHGVPVTLKDVFETAGMRTTSSYKPLADYVPSQDATVVARLRQAGAIILGKTNMPQLAGDTQSHSPLFGIARNPWDLGRTPGGSSGGEAAAIAAGLSPLGLGSDIGGSIRLPAHFCGLFAFKPTEHRVPNSGHIPPLPGTLNSARHMAVNGPLARSVADLRLCLSLIAGPDRREPDVPPVPLEASPRRPLSQLRIAWTDDVGGIPVSAETRAALSDLAGELGSVGCSIERMNPPDLDFQSAWRTYGELYGAMLYTAMPRITRIFMRRIGPVLFKDIVFRSATRRAQARAEQYFAALDQRDQLIQPLERFLHRYDAWLCPVAAVPAFPHRQPNRLDLPLNVDGEMVPGVMATMAHSLIASLTGHPAVVLPLAQSREGLPIGVQVIGRLWEDMALLNVAEALTEVTGPFRQPEGY